MTAAISNVPPVRLAKLIRRPGGKTISDALVAADGALLGMREAIIEDIRATLLSAEASLARREGLDGEALQELYLTIARPIGVASQCGMSEIDQVLTSLASLLDVMKRRATPDRMLVVLHLQALRLLLSAGGGSDLGASVVAGLQQVTGRFCGDAEEDVEPK